MQRTIPIDGSSTSSLTRPRLFRRPFDVDVIETVARNLKVVELFCTFSEQC